MDYTDNSLPIAQVNLTEIDPEWLEEIEREASSCPLKMGHSVILPSTMSCLDQQYLSVMENNSDEQVYNVKNEYCQDGENITSLNVNTFIEGKDRVESIPFQQLLSATDTQWFGEIDSVPKSSNTNTSDLISATDSLFNKEFLAVKKNALNDGLCKFKAEFVEDDNNLMMMEANVDDPAINQNLLLKVNPETNNNFGMDNLVSTDNEFRHDHAVIKDENSSHLYDSYSNMRDDSVNLDEMDLSISSLFSCNDFSIPFDLQDHCEKSPNIDDVYFGDFEDSFLFFGRDSSNVDDDGHAGTTVKSKLNGKSEKCPNVEPSPICSSFTKNSHDNSSATLFDNINNRGKLEDVKPSDRSSACLVWESNNKNNETKSSKTEIDMQDNSVGNKTLSTTEPGNMATHHNPAYFEIKVDDYQRGGSPSCLNYPSENSSEKFQNINSKLGCSILPYETSLTYDCLMNKSTNYPEISFFTCKQAVGKESKECPNANKFGSKTVSVLLENSDQIMNLETVENGYLNLEPKVVGKKISVLEIGSAKNCLLSTEKKDLFKNRNSISSGSNMNKMCNSKRKNCLPSRKKKIEINEKVQSNDVNFLNEPFHLTLGDKSKCRLRKKRVIKTKEKSSRNRNLSNQRFCLQAMTKNPSRSASVSKHNQEQTLETFRVLSHDSHNISLLEKDAFEVLQDAESSTSTELTQQQNLDNDIQSIKRPDPMEISCPFIDKETYEEDTVSSSLAESTQHQNMDDNDTHSLKPQEPMPIHCTCPCVNVGMKDKFVSMRVRDMWNMNVKDLLCLAGHPPSPKTEKEIALEKKEERNILLKNKEQRFLRKKFNTSF